jgi:hypothetical protein
MPRLRLAIIGGVVAIGLCAGLLAAALSRKDQPSAVSADGTRGARLLTWDQLMPPGEDERLSALYDAYFEELDRKLRGSQQVLTSRQAFGDVAEGSVLDQMPQLGTFETVDTLDGQAVRLPGYIVPLDYSPAGIHTAFLLVPYFGACIHSPPPPPNQIVYVESEPGVAIENPWGAFVAEGVLAARRKDTDIGDAAYTLKLTGLKPYEG